MIAANAPHSATPKTEIREFVAGVINQHTYVGRLGRSQAQCSCGMWTESNDSSWPQHVANLVIP